ncbi:clusterin-associated protein 1 [Teleopsis dalmanni]|uniref:clusterin-associated protein 1 n=1 Tax=Teleopsis dalmanni TaxID=139649 RepID=UPI0018CD44BE|nr:clusterin-associated protein 1 [Teleopsis dalmanni]
MSFKNVRVFADLAEHLKLLGYPKVFPLQALSGKFGSLASFHIVAEVLQWLAGLMETGTVLSGGVETEEQRVLLICSATEFFVTKSAIKLNPRKLYSASAITAAELQKITTLLIAPTNAEEDKDEEENYRSLNQVDIGDKMDDLRRARELSTDLTQRGVTLYDLLCKELVNRDARQAQANRPMELASVERTLKSATAAAQLKLQTSRAQLENARVEMNALNSKLQRKRAELERTKQRLEALQKIRPAHMQEFEECEEELKQLFQQYFQRVHVRDALRAQLEARTKRATPIASPILQKPAENSIPFIPEGLLQDDDDDDDDDGTELGGIRRNGYGLDADIPDIRDEDLMLRNLRSEKRDISSRTANKRPGTATSRARPTTGRRNRNGRGAAGSMLKQRNKNSSMGDEDDSTFGSSESDLDIGGILGLSGTDPTTGTSILSNMGSEIGGMGDDDFDLNSLDDISISKITGELPMRPKTANKAEHHSDEDF